MSALRRALFSVLAVALVAAPSAASACAVCMSGREDETRVAFLVTTVFMSVLPLAVIGGLVWWLVRRARSQADATGPPGAALSRSASSR